MFKKIINLTPLLSFLKLSWCAVSAEVFCVVYNAGLHSNNIASLQYRAVFELGCCAKGPFEINSAPTSLIFNSLIE